MNELLLLLMKYLFWFSSVGDDLWEAWRGGMSKEKWGVGGLGRSSWLFSFQPGQHP